MAKSLTKEYTKAISTYQTAMSNDFQRFVAASLDRIDNPLEEVFDPVSQGMKTNLFIYMREAYPRWASRHAAGAINLGNSFYTLRRAQEMSKGRKLGEAVDPLSVVTVSSLQERLLPHWTVTGMIKKVLLQTPEGEQPFFGEVGKASSGRIGTVVRDVSDKLYRNDDFFVESRVVPSAGACSYCMDIVDSFEASRKRGATPSVDEVNFHDHCNCVIDWL